MNLVIVLSVVVGALAAPEGYHYDPPGVSSTLYFPSAPSYTPEVDDCVEPEAHEKLEYQHQLPVFSQVQHSAPLYQTPVVQPLKTKVSYEKQQVLQVQHLPQVAEAGAWKAQEQQTSVWGSSGSGYQHEQQASVWGSSGSDYQQEQQASLWGASDTQQSLGSASWNSGKKEQTKVWLKPQHTVEEVYKHVYVHVPPEDKEEYEAPRVIQPVSHKQKHYKIIFIKAPSPPAPKSVVVPPQPSNEEKTIVYVLHQKPEHQQEVIVQKPEPAKHNKPEVFFIKYKSRKEEQKQLKYTAPAVAAKSVSFVDSGSTGYSSGSEGSKYSYVSSTPTPVSYSTVGSKNTGASYSYVSSTPAPVVYSSPQPVQYVDSGSSSSSSGSEGYQYSNLGNTGSSYSSFSNGAGAGYESYVDLGNSGYSSFSSGGNLGIINVDSGSDYHFVPSTTVAPVVEVTTPVVSYVSSIPHSVVSSTLGNVSVKNPGLSGYASRATGSHSQLSTTTAAPAKKVCRRCASTTSSTLKVQDAYVSNVY